MLSKYSKYRKEMSVIQEVRKLIESIAWLRAWEGYSRQLLGKLREYITVINLEGKSKFDTANCENILY